MYFIPDFEVHNMYVLYVLKLYDQNSHVDSIYTDFQKAFDKVNHSILLCKLKAFGFNGLFLK